MAKKNRLNNEQLAMMVSSDGLSDSILYHIESDFIEDAELSELWKQAKIILSNIQETLDNAWSKDTYDCD